MSPNRSASNSSLCRTAEPQIIEMPSSERSTIFGSASRNSKTFPQMTPPLVNFERVNIPGTIYDDNLTKKIPFKNMELLDNTISQKSDWNKVQQIVETNKFSDNRRVIDYVLAYEDGSEREEQRRKNFHKNLVEEGLELEFESKEESESGDTYFVKIHAPWDLLVRYASILKLKKPIKGYITVRGGQVWKDSKPPDGRFNLWEKLGIKNPFNYNEDIIPPEHEVFKTGFTMKKQEDMFLIKDRETFYTQAQRSLVVWEILMRVKYSSRDLGFGISRLLSNGTYLAAYPLHDGPYDKDLNPDIPCFRRMLYMEWGSFKKYYKKQPIYLVRRYFGDKMALYFAWLGFYTEMLIPASIMGIITFISGIFFMNSDFNKPTEEICDPNGTGGIIMCPLCDGVCDFWELKESCLNSKITFLFDNPATVVFSVAMSFWATMFLELWKRKEVVIQWQWDMESFEDEEELRPEYEERVTSMKINPVTKKKEPYLPFWNKFWRYVAANSLVLVMLMMVMIAVLGVIIYRLVVAAVMYKMNSDIITKNAKIVTAITAGVLNLLIIVILNYIYEKIVVFLTNLEMPRTQTEYEDSFTLKMFLFQSINFYASLIYIAFFKGRFFYHPGDEGARENFIMKLRYDMCDPAGCFFELVFQLAIIMIGKQILSNIWEIVLPIARIWWKVWWNKKGSNKDPVSRREQEVYTRWEQDYDLQEYTRLSLFNEYLEMVIQYGFVTLFVAAFPLAPLFAILNNIVEIRLDAYKYLTKVRRPLPQRVQDIGIWYTILKAITYTSVLTNALVISYTSDFIPRLVYMYGYSPDGSLKGYINNSLSIFNVSEYGPDMGPNKEIYPNNEWPDICHYKGFRNPPDHDEPYKITIQFYHVFTARLAFILIFEHIVFVLTGLIASLIPDVPVEVKNQMLMERKVEKEEKFNAEMKKIRIEREQRQNGKAMSENNLGEDLDLGEGLNENFYLRAELSRPQSLQSQASKGTCASEDGES